MSCESACYELQVACCESPVIRAGLPVDETLQVILQRPGGKRVYKRQAVVDGTGAITIAKEDLPAGFFGYGYLELRLKAGNDFANDQSFTFDGKPYDCVLLEIVEIDD